MRFVKHVKIKCALLVSLCMLILVWQYNQMKETSVRFLDQDGTEHLLILSVKDKARLSSFVHKLFAENSFAYTLLGPKPISWACYNKPFSFSNWSVNRLFDKYSNTLSLGWKTWSKYCHLFSSAALWVESTDNSDWGSILIVNAEQLNHVVDKYKQDFQNVLHRDIKDGFQLLNEAKTRSFLHDILQGHQALIGIVLGYGRDNSWAFLKGIEKREPLGWVWEEKDNLPHEGIRTRPGSDDIEGFLSFEAFPSFSGFPDTEESLALKQEYLKTQQRLIRYYKNKDFLEATLSLLAGYIPT